MTANRLQNIVITLDKVKMVLAAPGQSQGPAIYLLSDAEVLDHLWHGEIVVHIGGGCGETVCALADGGIMGKDQGEET